MLKEVILNSMIDPMRYLTLLSYFLFSFFSCFKKNTFCDTRVSCVPNIGILFYFLVVVTCFIEMLFVRAWTMIHVETRRQVIH